MDYDKGFILQKTVDWSLLNDGMTFPVSVCSLFTSHHIDPHFNRNKFQFEFLNGEVMKLKLYEHLKA